MKKTPPLIPMLDYLRIHSVIKAVLDSVDANTQRACLFFSVAGSAILQNFYRKDSVPVIGAALYLLDDNKDIVLSYAEIDSEKVSSSDVAFHAWVQSEGYLIDFMAPMFPEVCLSEKYAFTAPSCMFQKKLSSMQPSPDYLNKQGDFFVIPNPDLAFYLQKTFSQLPANMDLVNVCLSWYKRPPKAITPQFHMQNDLGEITKIKLKNASVSVVL